MNKEENKNIARFEKVSFEEFKKSMIDTFPLKYDVENLSDEVIDSAIKRIYYDIELPKRATSGSAGYDFRCPFTVNLDVNKAVKIPTGIRCVMKEGWVLMLHPRSSYGFKTGVHLSNTCGVVDEDYAYAKNEGHIYVKLVNDSSLAAPLTIEAGNAFCQGIFLQYGLVENDEVNTVRRGGIGSTGR